MKNWAFWRNYRPLTSVDMSKYRCTADNGCASYHSSPEEAYQHLVQTNLAVIVSGSIVLTLLIIGYIACCCVQYFKKKRKRDRQEVYHDPATIESMLPAHYLFFELTFSFVFFLMLTKMGMLEKRQTVLLGSTIWP